MVSSFAARRQHTHVYHWRHGWIPLTHAAALAKAHGNPKQAAKYVKPKRKTPEHLTRYYTERQEQDRRFERHAGGGISANDTTTQEYRDYYGVGDSIGGLKREDRYTYSEHLRRMRLEKAEHRRRDTSYKAGVRLGKKHAGGRLDTATENAQYDHGEAGAESPEDYEQGYADGIAAGYERRYAASKRKKANHA